MNYLYNLIGALLLLIIIPGNAAAQSPEWKPMPQEVNGPVTAMTVYQGKLIAAGRFSKAGPDSARNIAAWDGSSWLPMGYGLGSGHIYDMLVYNGNLIVAGHFYPTSATIAPHLALWDGNAWQDMNAFPNAQVDKLLIINQDLYVAGAFDSIGGIAARNIARWDGSNWHPLSTGLAKSNAGLRIHDLAVYQDELYVLGNFDSAGGISCHNLARWDGANWYAVENGVSIYCTDMTEWDGKLIIGAHKDFQHFPTYYYKYHQWDGDTLKEFSWDTSSGLSYDLVQFRNQLYTTTGPAVLKWNASEWEQIGSRFNADVTGFCVYNNTLYAYGDFNEYNGTPNYYIAWLDESTGIPELPGMLSITSLYPNPATDQLHVSFRLLERAAPSLSLVDAAGRTVWQRQDALLQPGVHTLSLPVGQLPPGWYILQLSGPSGKVSGKVRLH